MRMGAGVCAAMILLGEARKRYQNMERNIPAEYVARIEITDPEELIALNKEQDTLQQAHYKLGDYLIWIRMSKYDDLMAWVKSKMECAFVSVPKSALLRTRVSTRTLGGP